ncbi:hypothetical protein I5Q34_22145 [Streptomyces sp. AV19]|uniref:hypothetical protein n=1 Tax=Streptomyces sp. AV19 TaxID=2793068 RepID=UPI0018FE6591|nr:hypothetical protein [Streptomyces sp. AV19]MBH1936937.1 hypothetical protein [Streptomyces sp. AV19]MDG4532990.1 hypothetical protein [Streptomyces sp. AV19]
MPLAYAWCASRPRSGPFPDHDANQQLHKGRFRRSNRPRFPYHQQTKNLLVSYSAKKLGFF